MTAEQARKMIMAILEKSDRPMSSKEISDRILGEYHVSISPASVGANLGLLRIAEKVQFVSCIMGFLRVGYNVYPDMLRHWCPASWPRQRCTQFKCLMAHLNEQRRQSALPLERRRRHRPITDDMRQMIEDMRNVARSN